VGFLGLGGLVCGRDGVGFGERGDGGWMGDGWGEGGEGGEGGVRCFFSRRMVWGMESEMALDFCSKGEMIRLR